MGFEFSAVVGHSSGEIAAAYAAGFISARDAICIAYFRGRYANHAQDSNGQAGAMLAVEISAQDVRQLCDLPIFHGRMTIAANNSPTSVTLSGDRDRIKQAEVVFEDEKRFARLLKVDKAYHSHHMVPCVEPYLQALQRSGVEGTIYGNAKRFSWYSSVTNKKIDPLDKILKGEYWGANMMQPVLFKEALQTLCSDLHLDLLTEIGPHPALGGLASKSIEELDLSCPLMLGLCVVA